MYKYKAFISYRHCPYDMAVAKKLHRLLETFRIPDRMRKGGEKWVIFRDQEELPLCNDLSEHIKNALRQSEYLIVICSHRLNMKDSVWCKEEIRYFKELHQGSTRNIIAVLIDGTPAECFPEEICRSCDDGIVKTVEPLAANIVSDHTKDAFRLLNKEYLRLVACMIGCDFDTLYRREHRRKRRILLTIGGLALSVLLLIASISIYAAVTIYRQNQALLYEQSEVLTTQAQVLWEKGKPVEAIKLLLSVLSESGGDRSVNVNAEYALSQQIGAYEQETFLPVKVLEHPSQVKEIHYVGKGNVILTVTDDNVYFWNREDYSLLRSYGVDSFGGERFGICVEERPYENVEIQDGNTVFDFPYHHMKMRDGVYLLESGSSADPAILLYDEHHVWRVDGATAEILWQVRFEDYLYDLSLKYTEDGLRVITSWYTEPSGRLQRILDTETGTLIENNASALEAVSSARALAREKQDGKFYLVYRNTDTEEVMWSWELPLTDHLSVCSSCPATVERIDGENAHNYSDFLAYCLENYLCILEEKTGTLIAEYVFPDIITSIYPSQNGVLLITDTNRTEYAVKLNHIQSPPEDPIPVCYLVNVFLTNVDLIARFEEEYLTCSTGETEVYVYQKRENPDYTEPYPKANYVLNPSGTYALVSHGREEKQYELIDPDTLKSLHSLTHISLEDTSCRGFIDETRCFFTGRNQTIVYDVVQDNLCHILPEELYDMSADGRFLIDIFGKGYSVYDLKAGPYPRKYTWETPANVSHDSLSPNARYVCFSYSNPDGGVPGFGIHDMVEGTDFVLAETEQPRMNHREEILWINEREVMVLYDDDVIEVYDVEQRKLVRHCSFGELLPAKRSSLHTLGKADEVVVICENGKIYRLDMITETITGEINLASVGESGVSVTYVELLKDPSFYVYTQLVEEENLLILVVHVGTGWNDAWFLDLDSFSLRCKVPLFCDYWATSDKILVTTPSNNYVTVGFLPYYRTDELILRAKDFLGES